MENRQTSGCGPLFWLDFGPTAVSSEEQALSAEENPRVAALLEVLAGKEVANALVGLDMESVAIALEALELYVEKCEEPPGELPYILCTRHELADVASVVAAEVEAAHVVPDPSEYLDKSAAVLGIPGAHQKVSEPELLEACVQWERALDEATRWREDQLRLLAAAGPEFASRYAELEALSPVAVAGAVQVMQRLHEQSSAEKKDRAGQVCENNCQPIWWVNTDGEQDEGVGVDMHETAEVVSECPVEQALLKVLKGNLDVDELGGLAKLDIETALCVLEAVELHTEAPSSKLRGTSGGQPKDVVQQVVAEVERAQGHRGIRS
eukprot:gnl/TRDRNA2_/TRDRNA2_39744_c0_seq1.p1 gnl/TRDRNA2_/TRDRNA2_39744_c0~~gnl/TRDRNA2_/TRDRNA2_39744_c0_seq1.p1  ORF type:complete len:323 (+),score=71.10 gnl/TRDRNA2_/TRDRNA2_39744_c0_seq1:40-1008(+)